MERYQRPGRGPDTHPVKRSRAPVPAHLDPEKGGRISLHDVVREYVRNVLAADSMTSLNALLIDAVAATLPVAHSLVATAADPERAWWQTRDGYLLDHLIDHLLAAGRSTAAEAAAGDLRWVEARLTQRGPSAPWNDLARINTAMPVPWPIVSPKLHTCFRRPTRHKPSSEFYTAASRRTRTGIPRSACAKTTPPYVPV